jgi:hypothetical protein
MRSVDADPELKAALEKTRKLYNAYNKGMIEWLSSPQVRREGRQQLPLLGGHKIQFL